ncbi:MAG: DUF58 domain-containing protein [Planctomycetes bacterium]|nr:DUF58 domain-containing protein [Planctomycetota bacterium]
MPDDSGSVRLEVAAAVGRYRLALGSVRFRGRSGARRGRSVGSSMEFLDFRDYVPGDDLRHVDWRSYARSEQLRVRLHQEEVAPHTDVLVDTSASMATTPGKERAARVLALALLHWAQREGAAARLLALGGGRLDAGSLSFVEAGDRPGPPATPLRPNGVRVLLTDGLWPHDPLPLLRQCMAGAARFACVQLLDPWELAPTAEGALTLVDAESGARCEVQLDARAVAAYGQRLQRLVEALRAAVVGEGGTFVQVAAAGLGEMAARALLPAGLLEPA